MTKEDESPMEKQRVIILGVKLSSKARGVIERLANYGNVDTTTVWETLDVQSEELHDGELTDINEESSCDEKDEDISEEVMLAKNFTLEELLEISHDIKA